MTRVCLLGEAESTLQYELLSRETAREALATYDLTRPFENAIALRTVSVGAAVSLLNDLDWYLTRFVAEALVQEPSVSDTEWLSRPLATQLRNGDVDPAETAEFCKVYGLERIDADDDADTDSSDDGETAGGPTYRLVEPLYVRRTDGDLPTYDLRDVADTLVVRVTEAEFT
ncbi:DUF5804 family protein [Natrinema limicola]|uniref:Uncharacterized protein n=1 Tax=Natrinema limicola JCM 13563 TaxID=1230457 RepID=M0CND4_9EURY|nr:DUF5804 family protein [Natrinema limicola]ELZ24746.1 hypothetical protein C476_03818 [Natrinema limicola JCM 13563]